MPLLCGPSAMMPFWDMELLFKKAFGSIKSWGNISRAMGPLILVALGFSVASQAGFFNVGLPGQAFCRMDHGDLVCPFLPKYASFTDDSDDRFDWRLSQVDLLERFLVSFVPISEPVRSSSPL